MATCAFSCILPNMIKGNTLPLLTIGNEKRIKNTKNLNISRRDAYEDAATGIISGQGPKRNQKNENLS